MFFFSKLNPIIVIALIVGIVLAFALGAGDIIRLMSFGALLLYAAAVLLGEL
jgi:hypothetical protein